MFNKLKIKEFEVNMIYGFIAKPFGSDSDFEEVIAIKNEIYEKYKKEKNFVDNFNINPNHLIRNGWNTFYNLDSTSNGLIQGIPIGIIKNDRNGTFCDEYQILESNDILKWPTSFHSIQTQLYKSVSIRKDGMGTLTLRLKFKNNSSEENFTTGHVLRSLMLIPRTLYGNGDEITKINAIISCPKKLKRKNVDIIWDNYSVPYKLYLSTLVEELEELKIFGFNPSLPKAGMKIAPDREELCSSTDSQIPYCYVTAKLDYDQYENYFIKDNSNRKKFLHEFSGILGRWLSEHNIKYTSKDYWSKHNVMQSKFMNSLAYTIYSGMVTLMLFPDLSTIQHSKKIKYKELVKPIRITRETILRYIELSRIRWHDAIILNKMLDELIRDIVQESETSLMTDMFARLININNKIALHLDNPNYYLWDASLGSILSTYIDQNVINNIENDIIKKSNQAKIIVENKLDLLKNIDFINDYYELTKNRSE